MSSEERKKILQMVEEGKITAEQAASLMRAMEADQDQPERNQRSSSRRSPPVPREAKHPLPSLRKSKPGRAAGP